MSFDHLKQIKSFNSEARTSIYFDNAATNQRPRQVINTVMEHSLFYNANVHRGIHWMSEYSTEQMEQTRVKVKKLINASSEREIIFTYGTTHGINIVANGIKHWMFNGKGLTPVVTALEHHSNIVPWQSLGFLNVIDIDSNCGLIGIEDTLRANPHSIVAVTHISNVTGTINNIKYITEIAHKYNSLVLIDGAQAIGHTQVDVQDIDCDFYVFSGHKMFGPTGIGILYGKETHLERMVPYMTGGEMIESVSFDQTTYNDLPFKFEAGTPNISGIIGLGAAIDFINKTTYAQIQKIENELTDYALLALANHNIIGPKTKRGSLISWYDEGQHPHDVAHILDQQGIAVRSGTHCTQPLHSRLNILGTTRASFSIFNTKDEIDKLVLGLNKAKEILC